MKKPTRPKRHTPGVIESNPFTLPGHTITSKTGAAKFKSVFETVAGRPDGKVVMRRTYEKAKFSSAAPPDINEQVEAVVVQGACDFETRSAASLAKHSRDIAGTLAARARQGDAKALYEYARFAVDVCEGLSEMMHTNLAAFRPLARECARWPMMRSTHPLNCDPDEWLGKLALGSARPIALDRAVKWKPDFAATYAMRLFEHLQFIREENPKVDGKPFAELLPKFSRATAPAWWNLAWQFLLRTYPNPQDITELADLVPATSSKNKYSSSRKQAIKDKLKARFFAIAKT